MATYTTYPKDRPCPEPLRYTLGRLVGLLPPADLAPWPNLTNLEDLNDDGQTYANVCDWVNDNYEYISWFTNGGVVDAALLLVERALENGNLRLNDEIVNINFGWSAAHDGWLDVEEDCNGDCHILVPPASIDEFLSDCGEGFKEDDFNDGCEQYCEMDKAVWEEWITALYEPGEM